MSFFSISENQALRFAVAFAENKATRIGAAAGAMLAAPVAFAEATGPDAAFASKITEVTTSIGTYGLALVGVAAVGVGFMIGVKYIKKIRGAA